MNKNYKIPEPKFSIVEEPLVGYGLAPMMLDSEIEIIRQARKGIKTEMLWSFIKSIGSSKAEFEKLLPYSLKTFQRKESLDEAMSERILNIIRVFKRGEEVFGDVQIFKRWLAKYHPILQDEPINFLKTSTGCNLVIHELIRAQHGVMA